ncbi:alpha/beta fold hydrolase [Kitasatospora sp. NPDC004240]
MSHDTAREPVRTPREADPAADAEVVARLREHLARRLPPEAVPARFVLVDELPVLPNGKLDRASLTDDVPAVPAPRPATTEEAPDDATLLAGLFAAELAREHIGADEDLSLLGLNSVLLAKVSAAWTARTGRPLDGAGRTGRPTVRSILAGAGAGAGARATATRATATRATAAPPPSPDGTADLDVRDHRFEVPLDHDDPDGPTIEVFARTVRRGASPGPDLPHLLFLQGGPGGRCPDPRERMPVWLDVALDHYRVVLLDQRGGGRSSPVDAGTIAGLSPVEAAARIRRFRADAVVRDAEHLRERILGVPNWTLLGESYGGSIALAYLSAAPEHLDRVLISSGLYGPFGDARSVLTETLAVSRRKNAEYYERYPEDIAAVERIVTHLRAHEVRLPTGDRLTPERFALLGLKFGFESGMAELHELLGTAWDGTEPAAGFLGRVAAATVFSTSALFHLQEYTYGTPGRATGWTARQLYAQAPDFGPDASPFLFYGEVFFPWMFEQIAMLRPFAAAAEELARHTGWNELYDRERLRHNTVPVHAVAVVDDLYVPLGEQLRTAREIGSCWLTISPARDHAALLNDRAAFAGLLALAAAHDGPAIADPARHDDGGQP